jgi:hypothetical protein
MRWEVVVRFQSDSGEQIELKVDEVNRPAVPEFSQVGLLHMEGKRILLRIQAAVLDQQVAEYIKRSRPCDACGFGRSINDYRTRLLRTLYGNRVFRMPRFKNCPCKKDQ